MDVIGAGQQVDDLSGMHELLPASLSPVGQQGDCVVLVDQPQERQVLVGFCAGAICELRLAEGQDTPDLELIVEQIRAEDRRYRAAKRVARQVSRVAALKARFDIAVNRFGGGSETAMHQDAGLPVLDPARVHIEIPIGVVGRAAHGNRLDLALMVLEKNVLDIGLAGICDPRR